MTHPLDGARVLVTGATGFVGQAVLERLLSDHPGSHVWLLVRPRGEQSAEARVERLLGKAVFSRWRERVGEEGLAEARKRIHVLEGDLDDVPPLPGDLDVVIHSASSVSFDLPIDEAFTHNVAGPASLYRRLRESGGNPHVVHVSTAYVHGLRRGVGEEAPLVHDVDWREELDAAVAQRAAAERASRTSQALERTLRGARRAHAKAGPRAVSEAAEAARQDEVRSELVAAGRSRAQSLGWTDVYTFTKAMGERVAQTQWAADPGVEGGRSLSIVRPTIIESSLHRPFPGWIDGFKVADPLIAAYGRGILPEFPALADSVLDVIPVDMVVGVIIAGAARPATPGKPDVYQVASGTTNPLRFGELLHIVKDHFSRHPVKDAEGQSVLVPTWSFPDRGDVPRGVERRGRLLGLADRALTALPATDTTRGWQGAVVRAERDLGRLHRFMELYQPYTQTELVFDDARTRALLADLTAEERARGGFDVVEVEWRSYLQDVHIPNVPGLTRPSRGRIDPLPAAPAGFPARTDVLAVFDLQRTVATANPLEHNLWVELERARATGGLGALGRVARVAPAVWRSERTDRGDFIRLFLRNYAGAPDSTLRRIIATRLAPSLRANVLQEARERIAAHRAAGHRTILITGEIDAFVEPIADLFDHVEAGRAEVGPDGRWTGHLASSPLVGEARASWLRRYAAEHGMDLEASYAYGDSYADRAWLEVVGHPHAVNPDAGLNRHALSQRWPVVSWTTTSESRLAPVWRALTHPRRAAPGGRTRR